MTQNEIIAMAKEAGLHVATDVNWMPIIGFEYAEKLIALARSDERETCAKVCEDSVEYAGDTLAELIRARGEA